jgi:hypothetical protein
MQIKQQGRGVYAVGMERSGTEPAPCLSSLVKRLLGETLCRGLKALVRASL